MIRMNNKIIENIFETTILLCLISLFVIGGYIIWTIITLNVWGNLLLNYLVMVFGVIMELLVALLLVIFICGILSKLNFCGIKQKNN